jgi:hypothetical protein
LQLAWIATSPHYARHLARVAGGSVPTHAPEISSAAKQQLSQSLDLLAGLHSMADPSSDETNRLPSRIGVKLWNPTAAILWSVLLTPVFGTYLLFRNWGALGQVERERVSKVWLGVSLVSIPASTLLDLLDLARGDGSYFAEFFQLFYFLVWYFSFARHQRAYFLESIGNTYERKPWLAVVMAGVALVAALWALRFLILLSMLTSEMVVP